MTNRRSPSRLREMAREWKDWRNSDGGTREREELRMTSSKVVPDLGLLSLNSASRNSRVSIISLWAVKF